MRPLEVTFQPKKARRINKKAVAVNQSVNRPFATESVENVSANQSMRLSEDFHPSHCLSMRLDGGKGRPCVVYSGLHGGLPLNKKLIPNLKEKLELQREKESNVDTDDPQFIKFLMYGIRRDYNEWSLPRSFGDLKFFNKK